MSRHIRPANHRCAWCSRAFDTIAARATHEHLQHAGNLQRTQEAEAAARLHHLHQDRRAVELGRPAPDTPAEIGRKLASRMHGLGTEAFLRESDSVIDVMGRLMIDGGRPPSDVFATCRAIRFAARVAWRRQGTNGQSANDP